MLYYLYVKVCVCEKYQVQVHAIPLEKKEDWKIRRISKTLFTISKTKNSFYQWTKLFCWKKYIYMSVDLLFCCYLPYQEKTMFMIKV